MAECCAEQGYRATTVEAVMERAEVGRDSFEYLFAGKEDCALAALNKIISETLAQLSTIDAATIDAANLAIEGRIYEIRAILELLSARPSFARLGCIEARQGGTQRMRDSYEAAVRVLALMMERSGAGMPGATPTVTARAALGGAEALVRRELAVGGGDELPKLLGDFVYAALVPFVGQREALRQAKLAARVAAEEG